MWGHGSRWTSVAVGTRRSRDFPVRGAATPLQATGRQRPTRPRWRPARRRQPWRSPARRGGWWCRVRAAARGLVPAVRPLHRQWPAAPPSRPSPLLTARLPPAAAQWGPASRPGRGMGGGGGGWRPRSVRTLPPGRHRPRACCQRPPRRSSPAAPAASTRGAPLLRGHRALPPPPPPLFSIGAAPPCRRRRPSGPPRRGGPFAGANWLAPPRQSPLAGPRCRPPDRRRESPLPSPAGVLGRAWRRRLRGTAAAVCGACRGRRRPRGAPAEGGSGVRPPPRHPGRGSCTVIFSVKPRHTYRAFL